MATEPQESVWLFPPASSADENGLVAVGADITPSTLLAAYRNGLFPMPLQEEGIIGWWSPDPRGVLRIDDLYISKSLEKKGQNNKTSVKINLKDQPGSLMKILKPFSDLKINMTRIETRPSRNNIYLHTFFIDFEGFYEDEKITKLIEILEDLSEELRIIGSYESLN